MQRPRLLPPLSRALLLCAALLPVGSCLDFQGYEQTPTLTTEVEDWRDEVIYQVLVDRFANGDNANDYRVQLGAPARYHGGDWQGLEDQLPYLQELGVTTLWISPVVKNVETDANVDGYHGYWAQDFTELNPHFGDLVALRRLVDVAHERDMLVIIDIVANHVGQLFYYDINLNGHADEQLQGNGVDSPVMYINEYDPDFDERGIQSFTSLGEAGPAPIIFGNDPATNHMPPNPAVFRNPAIYNRKGRTLNFDVEDQLLHGDFPGGLKDVDTSRCDVKQAFVDVYARIIEQTNADGFRIDTIKHVEHEFWRYFSQRVRQRLAAKGKRNFFMFGEAFDGRDDLVGSFTQKLAPDPSEHDCAAEATGAPALTGDQLDSAFYFPQYFQAVRDVFQQGQSTDRIQALWEQRPTTWGTEAPEGGIGIAPSDIPVNFLDNHDVPRFLYGVKDLSLEVQRRLLRNALVFLYTAPGVPCLYYGTEQELRGGNDPANREDLWDTGYDRSGGTFRWIARLAKIRKAYASLRRGDVAVTWASARVGDEEDAGLFAFERTGGTNKNSYSLVVLNSNQVHASHTGFEGAAMPVSAPPGLVLEDALSGNSFTVAGDGTIDVTVEAMSAVILVPAGDIVNLD
ncbi:Maltodextrin glucosidase [Enhygromyxa salina]|uniref:alpha-amylase n=1 Tax=Enhygromyxa salina TaxID=215803 RepID=A0A0C2D973_9BACT|nr:alpha-amylase family glycosyl hydrolase [Enhygromyxa salina]KIG16532.1 Maltodextrin glucosidase [Enhygromyxa salina]